MQDGVVSFFKSLLTMSGWKIYYLEIDNTIAACCFVFEDKWEVIYITQVRIIHLMK